MESSVNWYNCAQAAKWGLSESVFRERLTNAALFQEGRSVRQVKTLLGISHGEAGRLRLRAAAEGLLEAESAADGPFRLN